jgi:adenosylcobinamide amidohydrolase
MNLPFELECDPPFLIARFSRVHDTLGWSTTKPGFGSASEVAWLEVHRSDLTIDVDARDFLARKLSSRGLGDAIAFMTSRDIRRHHFARAEVGGVVAICVTTVGLANGERVGSRRVVGSGEFGTINTLVHLSRPLSIGAFVEAVSVATEARTTAVLDHRRLVDGNVITGTGTDCIVVAAPRGEAPELYAGLHTAVGEAIGAAVYKATSDGARQWSLDNSEIAAAASPPD